MSDFDEQTSKVTVSAADDPNLLSLTSWLDAYLPGLWLDLKRITELKKSDSLEILSLFLEMSCQSQASRNIELGRQGMRELPRQWVIENIVDIASTDLNLSDEWEYRRLLELCLDLDYSLARHFVELGKISQEAEIINTAEEFSGKLDE